MYNLRKTEIIKVGVVRGARKENEKLRGHRERGPGKQSGINFNLEIYVIDYTGTAIIFVCNIGKNLIPY